MNTIHTVLGAGPVAKATVAALQARGLPVRVVHRSGTFPTQPGLDVVAADVADVTQLTEAFKGSQVVYMCAMPAYHRWAQEFDAMMANVLQACAASNCEMVFADNLYMYQESPHVPLCETTPLHPATRKGVVRARIAERVLQANRDGQVKTAIARASDFFGPGVANAMLGNRFFPQLITGKTVQWFGNPDMPHTFTYVPDFGKALVELGVEGAGWGEVWHVPNSITGTAREAATATASLVKQAVKLTNGGRLMLSVVGLFLPQAKEMIEMLPHYETPYVVDDGKWHSRMQTRATPWGEALALTVASYKK
ncbi:MAG: NAD-dependent epimerase/dehydratase family protein [Burkholderiaceae bacterium]|nr:NAD-dependent epimerase/dehydratase family protein [Burkholderiaceae bacterium]